MLNKFLHFFGYHKSKVIYPLTDILNIEKCEHCSQFYVNHKNSPIFGRLKIEDCYDEKQREHILDKWESIELQKLKNTEERLRKWAEMEYLRCDARLQPDKNVPVPKYDLLTEGFDPAKLKNYG